jgi:CSLREA domain-containing protein
MLLSWAVPALASANAPIMVTTTQDSLPIQGEEVCGGAVGETCTLRDAINKANTEGGPDTITFTPLTAGETLRVEENELPSIYEQVTIEGGTAQGATAGKPALVLEPVDFEFGVFAVPGISVLHGEGTRIEGFAIGGFGFGVELGVEETGGPVGTEICDDYIGTEIEGEVAVPNEIGVELRNGESEFETPKETVVGNGTTCAGNVISGNSQYGIEDFGVATTIAGNSIGIGSQPSGEKLPNGAADNGSAGIFDGAVGAMIGGTGPEAGFKANLIAFNHGNGILVENGTNNVSIRHNYIFENEELGIKIAGGAPATPTITSAYSQSRREFKVEGTVTGTEGEDVELEFFGNVSCDGSGAGEGATYLGGGSDAIGSGPTFFGFLMPVEVPRDDRAITATVTRASGATSEFSTCASYEPPSITLVVNTLGDSAHGGCVTTCSLREAIEVADETAALDTIDFADSAEGVIEPHEALPPITEPVEIDGTSAPGYAGRPLVLLDGAEVPRGEGDDVPLSEGLAIEGEGGGSVIKGLAVGGFQYGVYLNGTTGSRLCSSWVGVELDGATALPNEVGVEPGRASGNDQIGVGCAAGAAPNVISGNSEWGIVDFGFRTEIGGNMVGVGPAGAVMPNGLGGIRLAYGEGPESREPQIGGTTGEIAPNTIAYNEGPGILVESRQSLARIRANSIFGNAEKGISFGFEAPTAPTIASVTGASGALIVSGQVSTTEDEPEEEPVELDFFASAICSPLSAGVGETYLGSATVTAPASGSESYATTLTTPISDDESFVTVTATGTVSRQTTEFSDCVERPAPKHEEAQSGGGAGTTPPLTLTNKAFIPKNGEKVIVKPEEGKVLIKLPGTKKYVALKELTEIPVGAVIDATKGRVTLTSIGPDGTEQTAEFFGGVFRVKQREGRGLVVLELLDTNVCPAPLTNSSKGGKGASPRAAASSVSFRPKSATAGKLWGSGHGNFRTEGHDGSATVEGTIWLVEDRCNGTTFFRTRRGIVKVRDFVKHRSLPLPAGKTYLAGEG